jgi:hypothetical protein
VREKGIALTASGCRCVNPACGRELFLEIDGDRTEACVSCDPPREGLPTAFRMLYERTGGRLPPFMSGGHCSEDCCR